MKIYPEKAKSSIARCRKCKREIRKSETRIFCEGSFVCFLCASNFLSELASHSKKRIGWLNEQIKKWEKNSADIQKCQKKWEKYQKKYAKEIVVNNLKKSR